MTDTPKYTPENVPDEWRKKAYAAWRNGIGGWMLIHLAAEMANHAETRAELEKTRNEFNDLAVELYALRREVNEAVRDYNANWRNGTPSRDTFNICVSRFILPEPPTLAERIVEAVNNGADADEIERMMKEEPKP